MTEEPKKKKRLKARELLSEINNDDGRMIVIDNGSDTIKIGFSGEDTPLVKNILILNI